MVLSHFYILLVQYLTSNILFRYNVLLLRKIMLKFNILLLILFPLLLTSFPIPKLKKPKLLLISFDGFRWDYFSKPDATPNFDRIINNGVKAKWIVNNFVSVTFPNHYTIVTGLYEESHGIVANIFYDPASNSSFNYHDNSAKNGYFYGGEPIWVTNQLQGGRSGVYFWIGSEAEIKGVRPNYKFKFEKTNHTVWPGQVDTVVDWLLNDKVDLAMMYFPEPDASGHQYGPDSKEMVEVIKQCDDITGYLLDKLEEYKILDDINIIITSDHGMAELSPDRSIPLSPTVNLTKSLDHLYNFISGASLWTKEGQKEKVYESLKNLSSNMNVWKKEDIPEEYHYKHNPRVSPVFVSPHNRWAIADDAEHVTVMKGDHGYNNSVMDMHPIFIAMGPRFRKNYISEPFENVNIYGLMCEILHLSPAPNNGTFSAIQHLLFQPPIETEDQNDFAMAKWIGIACGAATVVFLLLFVIKQGTYCKPKVRSSNHYTQLPRTGEDDQTSLLMANVRY